MGNLIPSNARPGDFALFHISGDVGNAIHIAQMLNGDGIGMYEHAAIYVGRFSAADVVVTTQEPMFIEARPSGAGTQPASHYEHTDVMWSSGLIDLTTEQRYAIVKAAYGYVGTGYSYADYAALVMHRFGINVPGLRSYIESSKSMICSQLVDKCYQDAGVQLFDDKRWNGYVTPGSLWTLLESRKGK